MSDKTWNIESEEELRNAQLRLQELKKQKNMSTARVHDRLEKFIDDNVPYHDLSLSGINDLMTSRRWELVDILTEGEYAKLLQFRTIATEQAAND